MSAERRPILDVEGLYAGWGGIPCVRDLSLNVYPGEIVVVLGPNGAGKTTTLLTLAGVLPALGGCVAFEGETITAPLHQRVRIGLGMIPEERSVVSRLSVRDNLRIGPGPIDKAVALFPQLEALMNRPAGLLSGGEQRMLVTARSLAANPKLLLADELSLGLAPLIVTRLMGAIRAAADSGAGVLMVEQHARQALAVADRAYVLQRGNLAWSGTAEEARQNLDQVEGAYLGQVDGGEPHREPVV